MTTATSTKDEKQKELKLDQKAHEAQAKADKLQRHAIDNGKNKKAEKAQDKANEKIEKTIKTQEVED
jgi:hypothetical protein